MVTVPLYVPDHPARNACAVVLTAQLSSVVPAASPLEPQLRVPAIHMTAPNRWTPLDLDAEVFRYRIDSSNGLVPVRDDEPPSPTAAYESRSRRWSSAAKQLRHRR